MMELAKLTSKGQITLPISIRRKLSARFHHVDVILTGNKDFLEANIDIPIIISPSQMMKYLGLL